MVNSCGQSPQVITHVDQQKVHRCNITCGFVSYQEFRSCNCLRIPEYYFSDLHSFNSTVLNRIVFGAFWLQTEHVIRISYTLAFGAASSCLRNAALPRKALSGADSFLHAACRLARRRSDVSVRPGYARGCLAIMHYSCSSASNEVVVR